MPYDDLLRSRKIKPHRVRNEEIESILAVAERDLTAAERNLGIDSNWAYMIAYNAALQAERALMLKEGYRARGSAQHATVILFAREKLGTAFGKQLSLLDQMRRKRNRAVYQSAKLVADHEAREAVEFAAGFVSELRGFITKE